MNKKILALILALAMALSLLTGCGASTKGGDGSAAAQQPDERTQAIMTALAQAVPEEAEKDVVSFLTDGALNKDSVIMTLGGKDVTAGYYLFWMGRELSSMNMYYQQYGQTLKLDEEFGEGQTVQDYLHSAAENYVRTYCTIEQKAEENGLKLSAEQEKDLADYMSGLDEASVTYYGTTLKDQEATYKQNLLNSVLKDHLTGTGEISATDETMADYIADNGIANCRYVLFPVQESEDKKANKKADKEQKKKAQAAYEELSKLSGDELVKKFQEYQKQNSDGNTEEFSFNSSSTINEGFRAKVLELKENEVGITDKTDFGYFVLLRLPVDVEPLKSEYLEKAYNDMLTKWGDEAELKTTAEYDKLDEKAVCEKLMELQNTMNTAAQSAAETYDAAQAAADASAEGSAAPELEAAAEQEPEAAAEASAS